MCVSENEVCPKVFILLMSILYKPPDLGVLFSDKPRWYKHQNLSVGFPQKKSHETSRIWVCLKIGRSHGLSFFIFVLSWFIIIFPIKNAKRSKTAIFKIICGCNVRWCFWRTRPNQCSSPRFCFPKKFLLPNQTDLGWSQLTSMISTSIVTAIFIISSTAQGGGGSFKNRKPIGETGCCESRMAERLHWWTERWLELCFLEWLQWLQWSPGRSPHPQLLDVVWCSAAVVVVVVVVVVEL